MRHDFLKIKNELKFFQYEIQILKIIIKKQLFQNQQNISFNIFTFL